MSISSIVVRGFGSFGNGLLAVFGYATPNIPVGPGVCGEGFSLDLGAAQSTAFGGAHEMSALQSDCKGGVYK